MSEARRIYREGFSHFAREEYDTAIALYREALELDPDFALAWSALSMACQRKGDLDAALEAGRRVIELEPDEPLGHTNLSIIYQLKGMIPEAEDHRARAMQLGAQGNAGS